MLRLLKASALTVSEKKVHHLVFAEIIFSSKHNQGPVAAVTTKTISTLPSSGQIKNMINDKARPKAILCMQQKRIWMIQSCRWNKYFDFTSTAVTNDLVDYCCLLCYICSAEEGKEEKNPEGVNTVLFI